MRAAACARPACLVTRRKLHRGAGEIRRKVIASVGIKLE